ncbi:beta-ribofuranosylaminobenzene 5'-phosphate synthase family protein [Methylotetracoccus oryzae]|uniref:beta-ribofuranosylaminobenzene 5'-phosphate synthase family protein n=1 Tax=Methylotetracoccus oryzae TaxID=1919059 RepID=UPI001F1C1409|nr:beta-ribofuranosylaminobenzene 5'-phosphate synthase family protein [Methylotetracoccus oryzae]
MTTAPHRNWPPSEVSIRAPARLHMGFLDPSGTAGRVFGSIGVSLNEVATCITLRPSDHLATPPAYRERCLAIARRVSDALGLAVAADIAIDAAIPEHVGLGSGTQFALALALGLHRLYGAEPTVREVAHLIGRGRRSGVGIAAFENGGFIVDGGHGAHTVTPPLLARFDFPEDWRFILVFDRRGGGLHGEAELAAFRTLPPFPATEAARICHHVLLRALPALCERDLAAFGSVISDVQRSIGDYFSPAQGGRFTSPDVAEALEWLQSRQAVGIGQTSWGPTGFCLTASPERARHLADEARQHFRERPHLEFLVASARNQGADIRVEPLPDGEPNRRDRLSTPQAAEPGEVSSATNTVCDR